MNENFFQNKTPNLSYTGLSVPNFTFQFNGNATLLTGFPINISISNDSSVLPLVYLLCMTIPQSVFTSDYEIFKDNLNTHIYIQMIVIGGILILLFISAL